MNGPSPQTRMIFELGSAAYYPRVSRDRSVCSLPGGAMLPKLSKIMLPSGEKSGS